MRYDYFEIKNSHQSIKVSSWFNIPYYNREDMHYQAEKGGIQLTNAIVCSLDNSFTHVQQCTKNINWKILGNKNII